MIATPQVEVWAVELEVPALALEQGDQHLAFSREMVLFFAGNCFCVLRSVSFSLPVSQAARVLGNSEHGALG